MEAGCPQTREAAVCAEIAGRGLTRAPHRSPESQVWPHAWWVDREEGPGSSQGLSARERHLETGEAKKVKGKLRESPEDLVSAWSIAWGRG